MTAPAPFDAAAAIAQQNRLRAQVDLSGLDRPVQTVAGIDVSHDRQDVSHAAIVLMATDTGRIVQTVRLSRPTDIPYIPGLLSFREVPVILDALNQLTQSPDVLMVDGQGIAHPRRLGIAAHLGVTLDLPAVGVAKSRLCGQHAAVGPHKGDHVPLIHRGETIGTVLRSKDRCLPLYVSPGHKCTQAEALALTLRFLGRYRLPEPTRLADRLSKQPEAALLLA